MVRPSQARNRMLAMVAVVGILASACSSAATASPASSSAASAAATAATSAGAGGSGAAASQVACATPKAISVILVSSAVDANIAKNIQGMKDTIVALDKQDCVDIQLEVLDAKMSADTQVSQMQTAITKHPDVIMVDPVDVAPVIPVAQQAKAAGIKLFGFRPSDKDPKGLWDAIADEGPLEPLMADNTKKWMASLLAADSNLKLNVGLCFGAAAQTAQLVRGSFAKDYAATEPRVKIVAEKYCNWDLQLAQDTTTNWLTAHPEINLIIAANNQMAQGVINAIGTAGVTGKVMVACYDTDKHTVQLIVDGKLDHDTGFENYGFGIAYITASEQLALGTFTSVPNPPVFDITKTNAQEVMGQIHT